MRSRSHLAGAVLLLAACNRYEYRPPDCPPEPPPAETLTVTPAPAAPGSVSGVVVDSRSGQPVRHAELTLGGKSTGVDSSGAFRYDSVLPGTYPLRVRAIAYRSRGQALTVDRAVGLQLRVPLDLQPLDGCPGFMVVRVRKPWWKLW